MRRLLALFLLTLALLSIAGTALAEHGPIKPWDATTLEEHGPIKPW